MGLYEPLKHYSSFRRIALAQWGPPRDPIVHGQLYLDVTESEKFLAQVNADHGQKASLGVLVGKAVALGLRSVPALNSKVVGRRIYLKSSVDIFFQVDVGSGSDLAGTVVQDCDKKPLHEIARELKEAAGKIRSGEDEQYEKTQKGGLFKILPIGMLAWLLKLMSFLLYRVGIPSRWLGASAPDPFGSAMVTNVAGFGVDVAYAPLVPWTRVPTVVVVGRAREMPAVVDGEIVVRRMLPTSATFDHRAADGAHLGLLTRLVKEFVEHPNEEGLIHIEGKVYGPDGLVPVASD